MVYLLLIVFFTLLLVLIIDLYPQLNTWQSRIKIGRFSNDEVWKEKVKIIAVRWLKQTPTIKVTDNTRLIIIDILKGNYSRNAIQSWQEAALLLGLNQYRSTIQNKKLSNSSSFISFQKQ